MNSVLNNKPTYENMPIFFHPDLFIPPKQQNKYLNINYRPQIKHSKSDSKSDPKSDPKSDNNLKMFRFL